MWSPKGKLKSVNSQPSQKKKRIMKGPPLPGNIDPGRKGGGVHPIMAHMGRLCSKGVPFQASAI